MTLNWQRTLAAMILAAGAPSSPGADPERGASLYENHCTECHTSTAHIREARKADGPDSLRSWILRWQRVLELDWTQTEVDDVQAYLNARYYQFESKARQ